MIRRRVQTELAELAVKTPTLGYEDDTAISKHEIATIQLEEAINLFIGEKFLCALTLAGAEEKVLSRLLNASGQPSAVEQSAEAFLNIKRVEAGHRHGLLRSQKTLPGKRQVDTDPTRCCRKTC